MHCGQFITEIPGGLMTRTTTLSTLWCTALVATLAAYGCGSSSTIDNGTGGKTGTSGVGGKTGAGGGAVIIGTGGTSGGGVGGMVGGVDAGGPPADAGVNMCAPATACTAGFTCTRNCNAGGGRGPGTQACTCNNNNRVACGNCMPNDAGAAAAPGRRWSAGRRWSDLHGDSRSARARTIVPACSACRPPARAMWAAAAHSAVHLRWRP